MLLWFNQNKFCCDVKQKNIAFNSEQDTFYTVLTDDVSLIVRDIQNNKDKTSLNIHGKNVTLTKMLYYNITLENEKINSYFFLIPWR